MSVINADIVRHLKEPHPIHGLFGFLHVNIGVQFITSRCKSAKEVVFKFDNVTPETDWSTCIIFIRLIELRFQNNPTTIPEKRRWNRIVK
jgi:hypothetical protein